MQRTITWKALAVLGVTALSVSACSKANTASTPDNTPSLPLVGWTAASYSDVQQGGTLNLAVENSPTDDGQWNPVTTEGAEANAYNMEAPTWCGAITVNPDGSWKADPYLTTSVKLVSTSPETVEVKLNPDAKWQDGTPITADDFKATFAALSGKNKAYDIASSVGYDQVKSFDVVSPTDFTFTFSKPYADWPAMLGSSAVLPAKVASDPHAWNTDFTNKPVPSCGPYMFTKIDNNAEVFTLKPNPNWWGPKAKLDTITFKVMDQATQAQAFTNGEIDAVEVDQNADAYDSARKTPNSTVERSGGLTWTQVTFNGLKPGLDDQNVREAIGMAIDRQLMAHEANSPVGAAPVTQGSYIFMPGQQGYVDTVNKILPFDANKAQDLLKSAGYTLTNNAWTKNGTTLAFKIVVPAGTDTNIQRAKQIQSSLAKIHIAITLDTAPAAQYFNRIQTGNYDMATFSWVGTPFPISSTKSLFTPAGHPNGDGQNYAYITDPQLGPLWDQANAELDPAKRITIANQIDEVIAKLAPMVPIAPSPVVFVVKKNLVNYGASQFQTQAADWTTVGYTK